jgi:TRAP-type C4-dicarboxylate transport system permease small subunit
VTADRQVRSARILGLLFCIAGGAAIAVGWNGAARQASADSQLPYLLSGGAAGIALLTFGVGLLLIAQIRAERQRVSRVLDLMGGTLAARAEQQVEDAAAERGEQEEEHFALPVKGARILALVFAFAGFAMIVLGWNGMSKVASADQQLPYLLSGGFGGMALILFSVALLLIAQIRTERRKLMNVLEVMAVAVGRTAGDPEKTDVLSQLGSPAAPPPNTVVTGPSTYHRPDCRLVQGGEALDRMPIEAATRSDLSPCRVCDPDAVPEVADSESSGDESASSQARLEEPATV